LAKLKHAIFLAAIALMALGLKSAVADDCPDPTQIIIGNVTVEPCMPQRLNIPIFMLNPCAVGGFNIRLYCTDPTWLHFVVGDTVAADTFGSRISDWELFSAVVNDPAVISVTGIADMPGGDSGIYLPPGNGLIFTIHPVFNNYLVCDTSQLINFMGCSVSDPSGWTIFELDLQSDSVYVNDSPCNHHPRGDANCNGVANGVDVTYLINFFKGLGPSFCCLCSGDANNNNVVNGIDVTFFINYLKGFGPAPDPCD